METHLLIAGEVVFEHHVSSQEPPIDHLRLRPRAENAERRPQQRRRWHQFAGQALWHPQFVSVQDGNRGSLAVVKE
ncbi:MAG: hypothetical protein F4059_03940 [Gemmatimonadetes bacterium]|nr:hypothetical protein [Gemmatimonadota bacterium]